MTVTLALVALVLIAVASAVLRRASPRCASCQQPLGDGPSVRDDRGRVAHLSCGGRCQRCGLPASEHTYDAEADLFLPPGCWGFESDPRKAKHRPLCPVAYVNSRTCTCGVGDEPPG